jgi:Ca2+-binding RTX toxin-like protein
MQRQTRNDSRKQSRQELPAEAFALQNLESRQLMSAVPLTVSSVATSQGRELVVTGNPGTNSITVDQTSAGFEVKNGTGWKHLYSGHYKLLLVTGGSGSNVIKLEPSVTVPATLRGGAGNDTLYAGSGPDELIGW